MFEGGRKFLGRWLELLVPLIIIVVGVAALQDPLGHRFYALAGVLICAVAAYLALSLGRRSGLAEFLDRFKSGF